MTASRIAPAFLVLALAAFWPALANAAQLVVVEARGVAYAQGATIDSTKPLTLKEGQHLTLISPTGVTLQLDGPYNQAPTAAASKGTDLSTKLAALAGGGQRLGEVGTTRGTKVARLPSAWLLDVDRSGAVCLRDGDTAPVFWRASDAAATDVVIVPDDRSWRATVSWPAGHDTLAILGKDVPIHANTTYYVTLAGERHAISVHEVPKALSTDRMRVAWLAQKGCAAQAEALLQTAQ